MKNNKIIAGLIMILLRKKLSLKRNEWFRFTNQKENCCYCLSKYSVYKKYQTHAGYTPPVKSNVALNWLLDQDCKIIKETFKYETW